MTLCIKMDSEFLHGIISSYTKLLSEIKELKQEIRDSNIIKLHRDRSFVLEDTGGKLEDKGMPENEKPPVNKKIPRNKKRAEKKKLAEKTVKQIKCQLEENNTPCSNYKTNLNKRSRVRNDTVKQSNSRASSEQSCIISKSETQKHDNDCVYKEQNCLTKYDSSESINKRKQIIEESERKTKSLKTESAKERTHGNVTFYELSDFFKSIEDEIEY